MLQSKDTVTLNISELSAPTKRHRVAEWIRKHDQHICCYNLRTKDLHRLKENDWRKIFQSMDRGKMPGFNTYIRQNRIQNKGHKKAQGRTLHNTQGKNPSRRHKYYKYISTQHKSTQIYKENLGGLQDGY